MHRLLSRNFSKWAVKNKISKNDLRNALNEVESGLHDAKLGGYLYKKRIAINAQGKRGGARTLICYHRGNRAIFIHGFVKKETDNISKKELAAFKEFSKMLVSLSHCQILTAIEHGDLEEIE